MSTSFAELDRFSAVSLAELVSEAELLTRVDRKYLVPIRTARELLAGLADATRVLEIGASRAFAYDSVYFDTPDRLSYHLTAQRRRRRFKLRTRRYLDTGGAFLEVKTKGGRGTTVKRRLPIDAVDRARLTGEGAAFAREVLAGNAVDPAVVDALRPVLTSGYRRATLLMAGGSRATIDTELCWDDGGRELELDGFAIIESKSAGGASELDRALWARGHRPSGISKFGTGTAALHPELPSNKWARVLGSEGFLERVTVA